ncbi:MAG TPA: enoyl-ACP reductase [Armatimonadota bacterium]|jgi:enoyl-[acyl-carrier protein] reductase I
MGGICSGKVILIAGVANEKSLAWGIARSVHREGAQVVLSCQEALLSRATSLAEQIGGAPLITCDVNSDEDLAGLTSRLRADFGHVDGLAHCIAYAPRVALRNPLSETTRGDFGLTMETSVHSLCALTAALLPLMVDRGGSVLTLTYDTTRAYPNYNVMGVAKAALEAEVRYLAMTLGPQKVRVNAISAGAQNTLAARGISDFIAMKQMAQTKAPLGWDPDDTTPVGDAAAYLFSDLSRAVTGTVHFVDGGTHVVGG